MLMLLCTHWIGKQETDNLFALSHYKVTTTQCSGNQLMQALGSTKMQLKELCASQFPNNAQELNYK